MGWSSEVVRSAVPYTSHILSGRGTSFEDIAVSYCPPMQPMQVDGKDDSMVRRVDDSWLELILPFPDHISLRESMVDVDGCTIRFGKLFEILDALAADVAYRHACSPIAFKEQAENLTIVTACVDGMRNFSAISVHDEIRLQAYLSYVGSSSMEVCIDIIRIPCGENQLLSDRYNHAENQREKLCGTLQFIMVARDPHSGGPRRVFGLALPDSPGELDPASLPSIYSERFAQGKQRAGERRSKSASSLAVSPPMADEVAIIHKLYLASKELKLQKNMYLMGLSGANHAGTVDNISVSRDQRERNEVNCQGDENVTSLLRNLQNGKIKWMSHTVFKNIVLMQPQARNVHSKIFGGYIMRVAYEMAQVTAMCFFGDSLKTTSSPFSTSESLGNSHTQSQADSSMYSSAADAGAQVPVFVAGDDVKFIRPIEIGDVMEFASTVIYSSGCAAVVQVVANEIDQYSSKRTPTNMFTYVFSSGGLGTTPTEPMVTGLTPTSTDSNRSVQVMPREYDEFVLYLEGKRSLDHAMTAMKTASEGALCTIKRNF